MHKRYKKIVESLGENTFTNQFGGSPEESIEEKMLNEEGRD